MKTKKLASIKNPMSEEDMHPAPSSDEEGIGDKISGFAKYASPKKGNRAAMNGFAQCLSNVGGDKSGFAKSNFLVKNKKKRTMPASASTEKTHIAKMKKFRSPIENIPVKSAAHVPTKSGQHNSTQSVERVPTKLASAGNEDGYAPISQEKMRRLRSPTESIVAKSAECVPIKPGQHNSTQSGKCVPTKPGHQSSTQSGQRIPAQSEHQNANQQLTPQSQSRQGTSHSGDQTTPNQSRESRQLTPQSQSRQGTPNLSSSVTNNDIYWNIGSTDSDGRTRVEVIKKVLEPSHECSSKIRQIMYERLEPTGYNWKSISKETQDFYFEEFKEKFERLCEEQVKAGLPVDKNSLFLEAAGGFDKKKRVYGVGSSQNLFYRPQTAPCSSSFANVENQKLREELKEVKDKMTTMENQIAKILEINSFRCAQSPDADDVSQNGDE